MSTKLSKSAQNYLLDVWGCKNVKQMDATTMHNILENAEDSSECVDDKEIVAAYFEATKTKPITAKQWAAQKLGIVD